MLVKWLRELLDKELRRQGDDGLVVWYDPEGNLKSVVEQVVPQAVLIFKQRKV